MPIPAVAGFIINAISNAVIGLPLYVSRLAVLSWAAKSTDVLEPGVLNLPVDDAVRKEAERKIVDDFLRDTLPLSWPSVDQSCNRNFQSAQNWTPPRDPLVLDLNGGGIQTVAIDPARPILFDMDGDGTKHATGWVAAGEAIVVRDINGNGLIDSGRELFGDATVLTRDFNIGQLASNGFEALRDLDLDSNGTMDGKFDANDVAYSSVKLWQDTNQDGISQAGELRTFTELGVASINVSGTASNINLGGGNTQAFTGSFTRTNGQSGNAGTAELAGSLLLAANNFYREFSVNPPVTTTAKALPQMQGSGTVRDLREAMSLGTAGAQDVKARLTRFAVDEFTIKNVAARAIKSRARGRFDAEDPAYELLELAQTTPKPTRQCIFKRIEELRCWHARRTGKHESCLQRSEKELARILC